MSSYHDSDELQSEGILYCLWPGDEAVTSSLDLTPPYNATGVTYQTIAAQCCLPGNGSAVPPPPQEVCRRKPTSSGGISPSNEDCVAGYGGEGDITPFTYAETKHFCDSLGLDLCQQACSYQGCNYDAFPVWTGLPCPNKPAPPSPPSPPAPPPSPPSPPSPPPPSPWAPTTIPDSGIAIVSGAGSGGGHSNSYLTYISASSVYISALEKRCNSNVIVRRGCLRTAVGGWRFPTPPPTQVRSQHHLPHMAGTALIRSGGLCAASTRATRM